MSKPCKIHDYGCIYHACMSDDCQKEEVLMHYNWGPGKCSYADFIQHHKTDDWGSSIFIMEKCGKAFGRIYWYDDDNTTVYLDMLSVDPDSRKQGLGTRLQEMREQIGRSFGTATSCLWVKKNTWMHEWYKRRGYSDLKEHEEEENAVWMLKKL